MSFEGHVPDSLSKATRHPSARTLELSVVIVNWNTREHLRRCISSVPAACVGLSHEIVVVDNASKDGSADLVAKQFPQAKLIRNPTNLGFGAGCNLGAATAGASHLAFVNPDIVLGHGSLARITSFLRRHPRAALAGPHIRLPDGRSQSGAYSLPHWTASYPGLNTLAARLRTMRRPLRDFAGAARCDWVHGSCFVVKARDLKRVGGVPAVTFLYGEEMLLGYQLKRVGLEAWYLPFAKVAHYDDAAADQLWSCEEKLLAKARARNLVMREILSPVDYRLWSIGNVIRSSARLALSTLLGSPRRDFVRRQLHVHLNALCPGTAGATTDKSGTTFPRTEDS